MPRFSDGSPEQTEVEKQNKTVEHLLEIHYYDASDGTVSKTRLTTAGQDLQVTVDSGTYTWSALGLPEERKAFAIEPIQETQDLRAQSVQITLDGVDQTITAFLGTHHFRGRPIKIWRVWLDPTDGTVTEVVKLWQGLQNDPYEISENDIINEESDTPPTSTITTQSVSDVARLERARPVLTNPDSHNNMLDRIGESVGDTGFQNVVKIQDKKIWWGRDRPDESEGDGGGGGQTSGHGGSDDRPGGPTPFTPVPEA